MTTIQGAMPVRRALGVVGIGVTLLACQRGALAPLLAGAEVRPGSNRGWSPLILGR